MSAGSAVQQQAGTQLGRQAARRRWRQWLCMLSDAARKSIFSRSPHHDAELANHAAERSPRGKIATLLAIRQRRLPSPRYRGDEDDIANTFTTRQPVLRRGEQTRALELGAEQHCIAGVGRHSDPNASGAMAAAVHTSWVHGACRPHSADARAPRRPLRRIGSAPLKTCSCGLHGLYGTRERRACRGVKGHTGCITQPNQKTRMMKASIVERQSGQSLTCTGGRQEAGGAVVV